MQHVNGPVGNTCLIALYPFWTGGSHSRSARSIPHRLWRWNVYKVSQPAWLLSVAVENLLFSYNKGLYWWLLWRQTIGRRGCRSETGTKWGKEGAWEKDGWLQSPQLTVGRLWGKGHWEKWTLSLCELTRPLWGQPAELPPLCLSTPNLQVLSSSCSLPSSFVWFYVFFQLVLNFRLE